MLDPVTFAIGDAKFILPVPPDIQAKIRRWRILCSMSRTLNRPDQAKTGNGKVLSAKFLVLSKDKGLRATIPVFLAR